MVAEVIALSLLFGLLLFGIVALIWGWVSLDRGQLSKGHPRYNRVSSLMLVGSLSTGLFLPVALLFIFEVIGVPLIVEVGILAALSIVFMIWGELSIRSAAIHGQKQAQEAPYVILLGVVLSAAYFPNWVNFPRPLRPFYFVALLILLPLGQYWLNRHWRQVGKKRQPSE